MAKRYIGIDLDGTRLSYAALTLDQGRLRLTATAQQELTATEQLGPALRELLGDDPAYSDRLAACLPASQALIRTLDFPFADAKKITAALPFEFSTQLPIDLGAYEVIALPATRSAGGHQVTAAAVAAEALSAALAPFDDAGLPLHILDLSPFAYAAGLRLKEASVLVDIRATEFTVAAISDGRVSAQRTRKITNQLAADALAQHIIGECRLLGAADEWPLVLLGTQGDRLITPLARHWPKVCLADPLPGTTIEPEFLATVTLAVRAWREKSATGFNFRRGNFALRGEWQSFKRRLLGLGALALLALLCFSVSAWINHERRAARAEQLHNNMVSAYFALFPGAQTVIDVPLQLSAKIDELRNHPLLAIDRDDASVLKTLREISARTPNELAITLRALEFEPGTTRLEGRTSSFDAINRFAAGLGQSPLFSTARIDDAKMSADGRQVDFRLLLLTAQGGVQ
ncbi:MAG: PilN domain-containing protein [Desulfuromonadaceae bacterium]|nr:PilN domain-containing protein [Desulfuromonadaceae bacterium]